MSSKAYIKGDRRDFSKEGLLESQVPLSPYPLFTKWINLAVKSNIIDANALTLCTVSECITPQSRVVLLRNLSEDGFVFYTNYHSAKGKAIAFNPSVSLNFFWPEIDRQVRVEGIAEKVSEQTSSNYFSSRPRKSQLGALVSNQSDVIVSRTILEEKMMLLTKEYEGKDIPKPKHWGGYLVKPSKVEFWLGRPSRLHDRILYTKQSEQWQIERLSP